VDVKVRGVKNQKKVERWPFALVIRIGGKASLSPSIRSVSLVLMLFLKERCCLLGSYSLGNRSS